MPDPIDNQRPPQNNVMKHPPKFNTERSYERFQDEVKVWEKITSIQAEARGSLLVLSLPETEF